MWSLDRVSGLLENDDNSDGYNVPHEILFLDEARINSYFEQISDPVVYDEVTESEFRGSPVNPFASLRNRKTGREPTIDEKINDIIQVIKQTNNKIDNFFIESGVARRGHIPSPDSDDRLDDLWIWVLDRSQPCSEDMNEKFQELLYEPESVGTRASNGVMVDRPRSPSPFFSESQTIPVKGGFLALVEEIQDPTDKPRRFSGMSTLHVLFRMNGITNTPLDLKHLGDYRDSLDEDEDLEDEDLLSLINTLGAEFGRQREILTIYSMEAAYGDMNNDGAETNFGYPIIIWSI